MTEKSYAHRDILDRLGVRDGMRVLLVGGVPKDLRSRLAERSAVDLVKDPDGDPVNLVLFAAADVAALSSIRGCNGCELALGRKLGASEIAYGWVQKISNLILNISMVVRDVGSGRLLAAGSVDIRGNTDESWRRGVVYLLEHRILPALARQ